MRTIPILTIILVFLACITAGDANAGWNRTKATWYGPSFYGNGTACGQTYSQTVKGVAIGRSKRGVYYASCGTRFYIKYQWRTVLVQVIDRCPGCVGEGHRFDLSARTSMDLCRCWKPFTMRVKWRAA
jgi:hypothetical protein